MGMPAALCSHQDHSLDFYNFCLQWKSQCWIPVWLITLSLSCFQVCNTILSLKKQAHSHYKMLPAQKTLCPGLQEQCTVPTVGIKFSLNYSSTVLHVFHWWSHTNEEKKSIFHLSPPKTPPQSRRRKKKKLMNAIIKPKVSNDSSLNYLLSVKLKLKRLRRMQANCMTELG